MHAPTGHEKFKEMSISGMFMNSHFLSIEYDDFIWLLNKDEPFPDGQSGVLSESPLVWSALSQAQESHGEQKRDSGGNYLTGHILPVAASYILHERFYSCRAQAKGVAAALTHDTPEDDDNMNGALFESRFGAQATFGKGDRVKPDLTVAVIVELLTNKNPALYEGDKSAAKQAYLNQLFSEPTPPIINACNPFLEGITPSLEAVLIARKLKALDRNHNVYTLHGTDASKLMRKVEETERDYMSPLSQVSPIVAESIAGRLEELKDWVRTGCNSNRFFSAIPRWWWTIDSEFCSRIAGYNLSVGFQFRELGVI